MRRRPTESGRSGLIERRQQLNRDSYTRRQALKGLAGRPTVACIAGLGAGVLDPCVLWDPRRQDLIGLEVNEAGLASFPFLFSNRHKQLAAVPHLRHHWVVLAQ